MTDRPSDRAIAQAFWDEPAGFKTAATFIGDVFRRAREIDAAAPEGAQGAVIAGEVCIRADSIDLCPSPEARSLHQRFGDSEHKLYILATPPRPQDAARDKEYFLCEREHIEDENRPLTALSFGMEIDGKTILTRKEIEPASARDCEPVIACHRTVTGNPPAKWAWMDGAPLPGALDNLKVHPSWSIEYAYFHPPQQFAAPDWRIELFERWRARAQELGFIGICDAINAHDQSSEAVAERARDREDAERYRWLRDEANEAKCSAPMVMADPLDRAAQRLIHGEELDAAIDAARAAGGGGSHA